MSESNVINKINRRLKPLGQKLRTKRSDGTDGPHYILDGKNFVVRRRIHDLAGLLEELSEATAGKAV